MFLGKTRDVWKRELIELFWFTSAITVLVLLLYWYSTRTGISMQDAFRPIASIYVLSLVAYFVLLCLLSLWRRQKCLLDLGGLPSLVGTPFIISVAILFSFYWWNKLSVGLVFIIVLCLRQMLSRLLVVDNGICFYGHLLKWQNIESYSWDGDATPKLKLRTKRQFLGGFQNEIVVDIPNDRRKAVSNLLEQYVSKQEATI